MIEEDRHGLRQQDVFRIAQEQSALECHCSVGAFRTGVNRAFVSRPHAAARRYLTLPHILSLVSYGPNVVASCREELVPAISSWLAKLKGPAWVALETPVFYEINRILEPYRAKICFTSEYWLPDLEELEKPRPEPAMRILDAADLSGLYKPEWKNALCKERKELDVLGVGAYEGDELVGLAGCSADCDAMWQIGVDVLPSHRYQGIGAALTRRLALETLKRGKVPFYCCALPNLGSVRTAIHAGFRPAWVEASAQNDAFIETIVNDKIGSPEPEEA